MLEYLKHNLKQKYSNWLYLQAAKRGSKAFFQEFLSKELEKLTMEEKQIIEIHWGKIIPKTKLGFEAYRIYKTFYGFNVQFVPEAYFYPYILRSLNPTQDYISFSHKGLIDIIFKDLSTPKTLLYKIGSQILGNNYNGVSETQILHIISNNTNGLILKPTKNTNSGQGIMFIEPATHTHKIYEVLNSFKGDWVLQEIVQQSSFTSQFNPTSLNTFRVITLYLNNVCSICCTILKLGAKGKRVDNGVQGAQWIDIDKEGRLAPTGHTLDGSEWKAHNNIEFKNKIVPNIEKLRLFAIEAHKRLPGVGIVGWDIALDSSNEPVLIEGNLWWPSVSYPQLLSAKPFFGERTEEVINYVRSNPPSLLGLRVKI